MRKIHATLDYADTRIREREGDDLERIKVVVELSNVRYNLLSPVHFT
jgi:hypothetical protein